MAPGRHQTIANIIPLFSNSSSNVLLEGRGPSRGVGLDRLLQAGERIHISFTEKEERPICNHASRFANEIGVAVRLFSPIQYESWDAIPDKKKGCTKFEFDMSMPHILNYVNSSMAERYSYHRYNCHKHFKKYATPSEAPCLFNHFESDEFKRKAIGEQPNEVELVYITHFSIKKEKMKEMEQEPVDEDGTPLSPKEIVELVVGKNFRGFGFRPTLPTSGSRTSSQVESEMRGIIDSQAKEET
ncbi:hypothetical protein CISIN_1g046465mg [Citrus sinensis]|uniref:Uncharacterized protein n=1 Tax=Citrus sinensis TaxID=2711 RepID=A0A067DVT3_CITSI|nr:hypothetical protein CISIN_1g046465mg [Citrus sinensis]